jgi:hypothetical protein
MVIRVYEARPGEVDQLFEPGGMLFGFSRSRLTPSRDHQRAGSGAV